LGPNVPACRMPRFVFQVQPGQSPELPPIDAVLAGRDAARKAALDMCADLARDIVAGLTENSEWRLDVRNEINEPVFRIRLVAETLGPGS
jgi:hypothetical protein